MSMPSPDWEPKSDFFKAIFAKADYDRTHKTITIVCPCCGESVVMSLEITPRVRRDRQN